MIIQDDLSLRRHINMIIVAVHRLLINMKVSFEGIYETMLKESTVTFNTT